jgi:choline dehydrogenase-like flavoprotein
VTAERPTEQRWPAARRSHPSELHADVAVIGGGLGGVAAGLAAARAGCTVVLTEDSEWLGGQLTSQAVPPDEHPWIESFGCTASYRRLRDEVRAHYRRWYPLSVQARSERHLNPGRGTLSARGDRYIDVACCPFEIPLGALVPVRMNNLLPAAKNIGTTHITNGCYRLQGVMRTERWTRAKARHGTDAQVRPRSDPPAATLTGCWSSKPPG